MRRQQAIRNAGPATSLGMAGTGLSMSQFWRRRNLDSHLWLDRHTTYNVSIFFAYAAYRAKLTANVVSVMSGVFSTLALMAAGLMDASSLTAPVLTIYALAQMSYILDCADGQLARATGTASTYGAFLDKAMDLASIKLQYGGFFIFVYRHAMAEGDNAEAQLWLFGGLAFIFLKLARFVVSQFFLTMMSEIYEDSKSDPTVLSEFLKNFMDHQVSLFNMLLFLVSPWACGLVYLVQSMFLSVAWLRYFQRGSR